MSAFHEAIKHILADVDRFLSLTLKEESLSKTSNKERSRILDCLHKLYEEYEVLNPSLDDSGSTSSSKGVSDESRFTAGSTHSHGSEEDGSTDSIPYTTVKALTDPTKLGYLHKKPTDLLEKFSKQKKYCVVHKNILYWFKKHSDKKHQGAVFLTGYEFKDLTVSDKEFVFELKAHKKKTYQFQADSREDLESWRAAVEAGCRFVDNVRQEVVLEEEEAAGDSGEEYQAIDDVVQAVREHQATASPSTSCTSAATPPMGPTTTTAKQLPSLPPPQPQQSSSPAVLVEEEGPQEVYDDGFSMPAAQTNNSNKPDGNTGGRKTSTTLTTPTTNNNNDNNAMVEDVYELEEDDNLIYEPIGAPPELSSSSFSDNNKNVSATSPSSTGGGDNDNPPPRPPPPSSSAQEAPPLPSRGANLPLPPIPPPHQPILSATTPPPPQSTPPPPPAHRDPILSAATPPPPPKSPLPPPPSASLPPPPNTIAPSLDARLVNTNHPDGHLALDQDFENLFYGLFTCLGASADELTFDRGDLIHVLSRDLALGDWWVGESYGKVGLVPKEFLSPAYELVA